MPVDESIAGRIRHALARKKHIEEKKMLGCIVEGATTALPPTKDEIEKLLAVAPRYGIEVTLPGH